MPKKAKELSASEVRRITKPGVHSVGGVAGLCLRVEPTGSKRWFLRFTVGDKRRDAGLGGYPEVPLKEARESARELKKAARQGIDPIADRQAARAALMAAQANAITFDQAVERFLAAKGDEWRNPKHRKQWAGTLATYAGPVIGSMPVDAVEMRDVLRVLNPIWKEKPETASRLRGRIERVLDYAKAAGHRDGENPARWRGNLDALLPAKTKIQKVKHHRAIEWQKMPAFMDALRKQNGTAARALEYAILTAARSGEVRGAKWSEIDLEARTWTVPAERIKAGRAHTVPLADDAVTLLKALPRMEGNDLVFPAPRGGQLSDMALSALMRRMKANATPHGMRSAFRDWAAESTGYAREVAEMALAHTIPSAVERAYRRGDLLEKRARLMADWAQYLAGQNIAGDVLSIRGVGIS